MSGSNGAGAGAGAGQRLVKAVPVRGPAPWLAARQKRGPELSRFDDLRLQLKTAIERKEGRVASELYEALGKALLTVLQMPDLTAAVQLPETLTPKLIERMVDGENKTLCERQWARALAMKYPNGRPTGAAGGSAAVAATAGGRTISFALDPNATGSGPAANAKGSFSLSVKPNANANAADASGAADGNANANTAAAVAADGKSAPAAPPSATTVAADADGEGDGDDGESGAPANGSGGQTAAERRKAKRKAKKKAADEAAAAAAPAAASAGAPAASK